MKKVENGVQLVVYVRFHALPRLLRWWRQNASRMKCIFIEKKNMLRFMRLICFVAFSADYAKKLAPKRPFILPNQKRWFSQTQTEPTLFTEKINWLCL